VNRILRKSYWLLNGGSWQMWERKGILTARTCSKWEKLENKKFEHFQNRASLSASAVFSL
jgi:hypothetical protein